MPVLRRSSSSSGSGPGRRESRRRGDFAVIGDELRVAIVWVVGDVSVFVLLPQLVECHLCLLGDNPIYQRGKVQL